MNDELNQLDRLAKALEELEYQAEVINSEAVKSTDQITRIEEKLTTINSRVEIQTKKAEKIRQASSLF